MNEKFKKTVVAALVTGFVFLLHACSQNSGDNVNPSVSKPVSAAEKFKNLKELDDYVQWVGKEKKTGTSSQGDTGAVSSPTATNQVETNNQSANVDEGDIIKFAGDRLIVLRDQHLIVLDISGANKNKPILLFDKELDSDFGAGSWGKGAWYDEMLVFGSRIVLSAYRYNASVLDDADVQNTTYTGTIELISVDLTSDGQLINEQRVFIESNDYYTGATNYATRKIGDRLFVYSPFNVSRYKIRGDSYVTTTELPSILEVVDAKKKIFRKVSSAIDAANICKGDLSSAGTLLHSVYSINMGKGVSSINATGVMGTYASSYYVTDDNFYINIVKWIWDTAENKDPQIKSVLYRFGIGDEVALKDMANISGFVPERFAMDENGEAIRFITEDTSYANGTNVIRAISLKLDNFNNKTEFVGAPEADFLSSVRFNGNFAVLAGYNYNTGTSPVKLADFRNNTPLIKTTDITGESIEIMQPYNGNMWIALGSSYDSSRYSTSINLAMLQISDDGVLTLKTAKSLDGGNAWSEAFFNDHAFFFDSENQLIGFPFDTWSSSGFNWQWQSGVQYFSIAKDTFTQIGDGIIQNGDSCEECWYGNSRAVQKDSVFYNLLGRELQVSTYSPADLTMNVIDQLELLAR